MTEKSRYRSSTMLLIIGFFTWKLINDLRQVSDIEGAEFRVLYSNARDKLDAFSRCRNVVGIPAAEVQKEAQIELRKKFAVLQTVASESRLEKD